MEGSNYSRWTGFKVDTIQESDDRERGKLKSERILPQQQSDHRSRAHRVIAVGVGKCRVCNNASAPLVFLRNIRRSNPHRRDRV